MKKIIVLTGAGISAESGIQTFGGQNGLWEGHRISEVATPEGWHKNRELVLNFYNERRQLLRKCAPNKAHLRLVELEQNYEVTIITQNVDDLHERAGSKNILHLHGELTKAQSSLDPSYIKDIGYEDIAIGQLCPRGSQLRPFIVWFGESVPMMPLAMDIVKQADLFVVIGTSLEVYPAASLIDFVPDGVQIVVIDPNRPAIGGYANIKHIAKIASEGMDELIAMLKLV